MGEVRTEFTIRINLRAVLQPACWVARHIWQELVGLHATDRSGRSCKRCRKIQLVRHEHHFHKEGPNTDWVAYVRTIFPDGRVTEMWPGENKYRLIREGRG